MSSTYITVALRREVTERAQNCCEYCKLHQDNQFFTFELTTLLLKNMAD